MARSVKSSDNYVAKSGAKIQQRVDHEKGLFVTGWKVLDGLMSNFKVFMTAVQVKSGIHKSKKGNEFVNVTIVVNKPCHNPVMVFGQMDIDTYNTYIQDWGWIVSPKAKNGGYIGKLGKKK